MIVLAATLFGVLAGLVVDWRIRKAADAEEDADPPLDRHLRAGRKLLVPGLAALGCLAVAVRWGSDPVLIPFLFFVPLLAGLAVVDLHTRRLPNVLTLPALIGGLLLAIGQERTVTALFSAALLFLALLLLNLLRPSGMGMGDVKLAGLIGLFAGLLGLGPALLAVALAAVLSLLAGLVLIAVGRITRHTPVPFGPWLALGTLVSLVAGPELVDAYLTALT